MRKIIVQLNGGLGNQLFQYAFVRNLAIINKAVLKLDTGTHYDYEEWNCNRTYLLGNFNIQATPATQAELNLANNVRIWQRYGLVPKWIHIQETSFGTFREDLLRSYKKNILLNGYWQNEHYFRPISSLLKNELVLKKTFSDSYLANMREKNSVAIHIRRGDYISDTDYSKRYADLFLSGYYKRAIEFMMQQLVNPVFYVFSDDIEWCKENLIFPDIRIIYIENTEDSVHDFSLMTSCKHQIIANSTFSWWAAWLNGYEKKIVICPCKWFLNDWDDSHYALTGWVKL
jgi:hypothetical protein